MTLTTSQPQHRPQAPVPAAPRPSDASHDDVHEAAIEAAMAAAGALGPPDHSAQGAVGAGPAAGVWVETQVVDTLPMAR